MDKPNTNSIPPPNQTNLQETSTTLNKISSSPFPLITCKCGNIPSILIENNNKVSIGCTCSEIRRTVSIQEFLSQTKTNSSLQNNKICTWTKEHFTNKITGIEYCNLCQKWLCSECLKLHHQFNSLLFEKSGIKNEEHEIKTCQHSKEIYFSYCVTCKSDFCEKTDKTHFDNKHNVLRLKDLRNKNEIKNINSNLNNAKEFITKIEETKNALINEFNNKISEIKESYDKWKKDFENYLEAIEIITNDYIVNSNSFQSIMNLINNSTFDELKVIDCKKDIINLPNFNNVIKFFNNAKLVQEIDLDLNKYINRFSEITIWKEPDLQLPKIKEDENKKNDVALIEKNVEILNKLKLHNVQCVKDYTQHFQFENLATLKLYNCQYKEINFKNTFPSLNKILFYKCPPLLDPEIQSIEMNLKEISFEKCNLVTNEYTKIMSLLFNSEKIRKNIQKISFARNNITLVDLSNVICQNKQTPQLFEMDFNKNKIYKFLFNVEHAPNVKIINLANNNLSRSPYYIFKKENIFINITNNIYLTGDKERAEYLKTFTNQLKTLTLKLSKLSLSGLFNSYNKQELENIIINPQTITNIKKLDLSLCSLDNDMFFKFIFNNKANFPELQVLNLNENSITDEFFSLYRKHNLHLFFPKLSHVYLNGNNIKGTHFNDIGLFVQDHKQLTKISFCKNPFNKDYSALNVGKNNDKGIKGTKLEEMLKTKTKNGEDIEINDFVELVQLVKFYDSDDGKKLRNINNKEKGFYMKFDLYKRFNFDTGITYIRYRIEKKTDKGKIK